jgi:hypothetical protein
MSGPTEPALPDGLQAGDLVLWTDQTDGRLRCREVRAVDPDGRPILGPETDPP